MLRLKSLKNAAADVAVRRLLRLSGAATRLCRHHQKLTGQSKTVFLHKVCHVRPAEPAATDDPTQFNVAFVGYACALLTAEYSHIFGNASDRQSIDMDRVLVLRPGGWCTRINQSAGTQTVGSCGAVTEPGMAGPRMPYLAKCHSEPR